MELPTPVSQQNSKRGFLGWVEEVGNKLPDPVLLFVYFIIGIIILSGLGAVLNWHAIHPVNKQTITTFNLISKAGISRMFTDFSANIRAFGPLTDQLVILLGMGLIEGSGLASAFLRRFFINLPPRFLTLGVVFIGVSSSFASDAGFMLLPPLAGMLFYATGRNPLAGIIAAYGSVAAGFAASFFLGIVEVVGFSFTEAAAKLIDPKLSIPIVSNYYFTFVSSILLPLTAFYVTEKIVVPRLGVFQATKTIVGNENVSNKLTEAEAKGLIRAGLAAVLYIVVILAMIIPEGAILRNPKTGELLRSPLMSSIILIVSGLFLFPGLAFGYTTGSIKNHRDAVRMIVNSIQQFSGYILVVIFASQLIKYFEWSNLGIISAVNGAEFLKSTGVPAFALVLLSILFTMVLNLFMPSHAGKLAFIAPIFVPLFMLLDVHPAASYLAYRIGDSVTNAVTPMLPYFAMLLGFVQRYKDDVGMGTLMANLLPYSISFLIVWVIQLMIWFALGLPLGPGIDFHYRLQ